MMDLADALTPRESRDGQVEAAQAQADAVADAIGRLTALLVEKGAITLDEAKSACGAYDDITPI
jgi:hypothetical protein